MGPRTVTGEFRNLETDQAQASVLATLPSSLEVKASTKPVRLLALDAFRGLTVFLMLLVNNVALDKFTPNQLQHAPWGGGLTLADLVFPWFLFATGAAIPLAFSSAQKRNPSRFGWLKKSVSRTFWLFALGCLIVSSLNRAPTFSLGVLQLIALAFLIAALTYPLPIWARASLIVLLLGAYWAAIRFVSVPGLEVGIFDEGQNVIQHFNRLHLESLGLRGLTSVVPTAALVMIAALIGDFFRQSLEPVRKGLGLVLIGLVLSALGYLWSLDLEFNKAVWTPSYILFSAGTAAFVIGIFTLVLDGLKARGLAFPLAVFGSNALLAYIAPILVKVWILQILVAGKTLQGWWLETLVIRGGTVIGGWLYTGTYILAWWLILLFLYRRKVFLRV